MLTEKEAKKLTHGFNPDAWQVYADWLLDQGRDQEAADWRLTAQVGQALTEVCAEAPKLLRRKSGGQVGRVVGGFALGFYRNKGQSPTTYFLALVVYPKPPEGPQPRYGKMVYAAPVHRQDSRWMRKHALTLSFLMGAHNDHPEYTPPGFHLGWRPRNWPIPPAPPCPPVDQWLPAPYGPPPATPHAHQHAQQGP